MDKLSLSIVVSFIGSMSCLRAEVIAEGAFRSATNCVESGTQTAEDRVLSGTGGEVWKTGIGTWVVPKSSFDRVGGTSITVSEGVMRIADDATTPVMAELPQALRDKAFFWVDATDVSPDHFARSEGDAERIERWYDVREITVDNRRYPMGDATRSSFGTNPGLPRLRSFSVYDLIKNEERTVLGMYFNGYLSCTRMQWLLPDGSAADVDVKDFFAVNFVYNSWGSLIGNFDNEGASNWDTPYLAPKSEQVAESLTKPYFAGGRTSFMRNGSTYLDGKRIDGTTEIVSKGLHLLEAQYSRLVTADVGKGCNAFFSDGNNWSGYRLRAGGDYLCEVLIFTNRLTDVERLVVRDYLARKWNLPCANGTERQVTLSANATMEVADGNACGATVHGPGVVVKNGDGAYVNDGHSAFDAAAIKVQGGSVALKRQSPLAIVAGQKLESSRTADNGVVVVTSPVSADTAEIVANEPLVVSQVGENVAKLRVMMGDVTFSSSGNGTRIDVVSPDEVYIPNHSFEDWNEDGYYEKQGGFRMAYYVGPEYRGWHQGSGSCYWIDFERASFTMPLEGLDGTSRSAWPFSVCPPNGKRAVALHGGGSWIYTDVTIAEPGEYEFSVCLCGRESDYYRNNILAVSLTDTSDNVVADFGYARWSGEKEYRQHILSATVQVAGAYRLRLGLLGDEAYVQGTPYGQGCIFDDLHLRRVPKTDGVVRWKIPNGDFERAKTYPGGTAYMFRSANMVDGWTIDARPDGWSSTTGIDGTVIEDAAGIVTPAMRAVWSYALGDVFNASRFPRGGDVELYFHGNGSSATTTFVPPEGRHFVEAVLASGGTAGGSIEALLTKGGSTVSLGRLTPVSRQMSKYTWPVEFVANNSESITLSFVYAGETGQSLWLDDVSLVDAYVDAFELVKDGDFERDNSSGNEHDIGQSWTVEGPDACVRLAFSESQSVFGADFCSGMHFAEISGRGGICQEVAIPRPGRYRFSLCAHRRYSGASYTPIVVTLAKGGSTIEIGRILAEQRVFGEHAFDFDVPEAGTWTLKLKGDDSSWLTTDLDLVSLKAIPASLGGKCPFARETKLYVDAGAKVRLDFAGTSVVQRVVLGGVKLEGVVSEETHPEFISGKGVLVSDPQNLPGLSIIIR